MSIDCIYWGIFLSKSGLRSICGKMDSPTLEVEVNNPHVTFGFKTPCPEDILGRNAVVEIVGYACDGKNEAFMVDVPGHLASYYEGADIPHVTISVSEGAKPVDSGKLEFEPINLPEEFVYGKIGYFGYDHRVHFSKPERSVCHDTGESRIFHCSACGLGINDAYLDEEAKYGLDDDFPRFCPYCGAKVER